LVAVSNGECSTFSGFPNCPWPQLTASHFSKLQLSTDPINSSGQSQNYVTTDGQSASLSWCQAPTWGQRPDFYYSQTVAGLLMWGALSEERMGLSFTIAAGPRHRSQVRVQRDSSLILLSQIRDSPNLESQVPVFIFPRNMVAQLYTQALGSLFVASYDSHGYGGGIRTRLHAGESTTQSHSYITTGGLPSISSSELLVLVIQARHEPQRKHLFHYCVFSRCRRNNVSTEIFPSNACCTVACLHSCYLATSLHVTLHTNGVALLPNHDRQAASASERQLQIWRGDL
jgi:hypothetical protein